jgi:hypothetical protein
MTVWAAFGTALAGLLMLVVAWIKAGQQQSTGAALEAGRVAQATANTQAAIAQAEAAAPTTQLALVDRLKQGTF